MPNDLPPTLQAWFDRKGWALHPHQLQMLARCDARATLLIAPTGCGKTMAAFLPCLVEFAAGHHTVLHTPYPSPPQALATDMKLHSRAPVAQLALSFRIESLTRTPHAPHKRAHLPDTHPIVPRPRVTLSL